MEHTHILTHYIYRVRITTHTITFVYAMMHIVITGITLFTKDMVNSTVASCLLIQGVC